MALPLAVRLLDMLIITTTGQGPIIIVLTYTYKQEKTFSYKNISTLIDF